MNPVHSVDSVRESNEHFADNAISGKYFWTLPSCFLQSLIVRQKVLIRKFSLLKEDMEVVLTGPILLALFTSMEMITFITLSIRNRIPF